MRGPADGVDHRIGLVSLAHCVKRREGQARLGPQRGRDQLVATGCLDRLVELDVFPGVDRGPVERFDPRQDVLEGCDCRLISASIDIDRRQDDRQPVQGAELGKAHDVVGENADSGLRGRSTTACIPDVTEEGGHLGPKADLAGGSRGDD
jgi:hypothetical protein